MASLPSDKSMSTTGTKRKRTADAKFYAVRVGSRPGIYHNWSDCLEQVKGFKNATFKSFSSLTDAERFLRNDPSLAISRASTASQKFYAVQSGRMPGVYMDWPSAQQQITGWSKPKFKSFTTRAEAEAFVRKSSIVTKGNDGSESGGQKWDSEVPKTKSKGTSSSKKQKRSSIAADTEVLNPWDETIEPGTGPLPPGAEDGFDYRLILNPQTGRIDYRTEEQRKAITMQVVGPGEGSMLNIYTDGSALGNGAAGAVAGVGVYFGPHDPRNVSEGLSGLRQTNQRAELTAIQRALEHSPRNRDVTIYSDSNYAIKCVTEWFQNWRRNGWQTANKKPVENKDLIELIVAKIEERNHFNVKTLFQWLKGHADNVGNIAADQLAVNGARGAQFHGVRDITTFHSR